jgi:hypothetical protein
MKPKQKHLELSLQVVTRRNILCPYYVGSFSEYKPPVVAAAITHRPARLCGMVTIPHTAPFKGSTHRPSES